MAAVFKITDGTTEVNFTTGYLRLEDGTWFSTEGDDGGPVIDTFSAVSNTTNANIRTTSENLAKLGQLARAYRGNKLNATPVWFYAQSDGESARRALVLDITVTPESRGEWGPLLGRSMHFFTIAVERSPFWEDSTGTAITAIANLGTLGGQAAFGAVSATLPSRISSLDVVCTTASDDLAKFWFGIRPTYSGTAGFQALWGLGEDGDPTVGEDTAAAADATAYASLALVTDFASFTTLQKRWSIQWGAVSAANQDDLVGRYLVLGRVKLTGSTTEVRVQLRHGWAGVIDKTAPVGDTYLSAVDNADLLNWNLVELGQIEVPPMGNRDALVGSAYNLQMYTLEAYMERLSAAGSIRMDALVLIPSEHMIYVDGAAMSDAQDALHCYTSPMDEQYAIGVFNKQAGAVEETFINWVYPVGGGLLVCAGQAADAHALSTTITVNATIYPRWRTYRTT